MLNQPKLTGGGYQGKRDVINGWVTIVATIFTTALNSSFIGYLRLRLNKLCTYITGSTLFFSVKAPDPDFECVSENVLETWQKDHHTFKKTEYTLKLQVQDKQFFASGQTKKAAKTAVANEAWNQLRIETITV